MRRDESIPTLSFAQCAALFARRAGHCAIVSDTMMAMLKEYFAGGARIVPEAINAATMSQGFHTRFSSAETV